MIPIHQNTKLMFRIAANEICSGRSNNTVGKKTVIGQEAVRITRTVTVVLIQFMHPMIKT